MKKPDPIWLYRITHIANLPHILEKGLVTAHSPNANPHFVRIGDNTLIDFRKDLDAHVPPGGKLSEYIPFYLGPRSPMLFQIATGHEGIQKFPQEEIVYIITSVEKVKEQGLLFFFSDGHVRAKTATSFADEKDLDGLDWDTIYAQKWTPDEHDLKRKQKKQAEFLVRDRVPVSCIQYIGVFNETAKQKVLDLLSKHKLPDIKTRLSPGRLYYDHL